AVRKGAGFTFQGGSYPEDFVLGDVEADGPLEPDAINSFAGAGGVAMFFPLGSPATWRVIGMRATDSTAGHGVARDASPTGPLTLSELQSVVAAPTAGSVVVRDPAWLSHTQPCRCTRDEHRNPGRMEPWLESGVGHPPAGQRGPAGFI